MPDSEYGSGNAADVRINVSSDGKSLQATLDQLVQMGVVDAKNAEQFKANNAGNLAWIQKIQQEYAKELAVLDNLYVQRSKAYKVDQIENYNKAITDQTGRMKVLSTQINDAAGAVGKFEKASKSAFSNFGQDFKRALFWGTVGGFGYQAGQWAIELIDLKRYIEAFAELQQSEERLSFAVKNIAHDGQNMTDRLIKQANELQKVTQFARKDIIEADTQLLTQYGLTAQQTETAIVRIADVAAATGRTFQQISKGLGEAMFGRTQILKNMGIAIKYNGDAEDAFNQFMEKTSKDIGEAAGKMDTLSGQIAYYNNLVEQAKQDTGEWLNELIHEGAEAGNALLALLQIPGKGAQVKAEMAADRLKEYLKEQNGFIDAFMESFEKKDKKSQSDLISGNQIFIKQLEEQEAKAKERLDAIDALPFSLSGDTKMAEKANQEYLDLQKKVGLYKELLSQMNDVASKQLRESEAKKKAAKDYSNEIEAIAEQRAKMITDLQDETLANAEENEFDRRRQQAKKFYDDQLAAIEKQKTRLKEILAKPGATPAEKIALGQQLEKSNQAEGAAGEEYQSALGNINRDQIKKAFEQANQLSEKNIQAKKKRQQEQIRDEDDLTQKVKLDFDAQAEAAKESYDKQIAALEEKYNKGKITEQQYNKDKKALDDKAAVEEDKIQLASLQNQSVLQKQSLKDQLDAGLITQQEYENGLEAIDNGINKAQDKLLNDTTKAQQALKDSWKETVKDIVDNIKEMSDSIIQALILQSEAIQKSNDYKLTQQDRLIQEEEVLAERGLQNTLAFQVRQRSEIEKQQLAETQKQKHLKELELLVNSVAEFAKKDPSTAIAKGLALVAATRAAEAVFAEEGGIIGKTTDTALLGPWGATKKHKSGKDRILIAEEGEGILSVNEMNNLGAVNFSMLKHYLKKPLNERGLGGMTVGLDVTGVESRLDNVEKAIKNIPQININWDEHGNMVEAKIQNGIKKITKYVRAL
jgi:hypothetical protein